MWQSLEPYLVYTWDHPTLLSRQQLFSIIVGGLDGSVAEELIFGEPKVTTRAFSDLQMVTSMEK